MAGESLIIDGHGNYPVRDLVEALKELENAYNHIVALDRTIAQIMHNSDVDLPRTWGGSPKPLRIRVPPPKAISGLVLPEERLVLLRVQLSSPGFWEFLGSLNPLEVIRKWMADSHERRKDRSYREAAERRRLNLENALLENQVLGERITLLRNLGATDADIAPLLNELVYEPLRKVEQHQDKGIFTNARISRSPDNPN